MGNLFFLRVFAHFVEFSDNFFSKKSCSNLQHLNISGVLNNGFVKKKKSVPVYEHRSSRLKALIFFSVTEPSDWLLFRILDTFITCMTTSAKIRGDSDTENYIRNMGYTALEAYDKEYNCNLKGIHFNFLLCTKNLSAISTQTWQSVSSMMFWWLRIATDTVRIVDSLLSPKVLISCDSNFSKAAPPI